MEDDYRLMMAGGSGEANNTMLKATRVNETRQKPSEAYRALIQSLGEAYLRHDAAAMALLLHPEGSFWAYCENPEFDGAPWDYQPYVFLLRSPYLRYLRKLFAGMRKGGKELTASFRIEECHSCEVGAPVLVIEGDGALIEGICGMDSPMLGLKLTLREGLLVETTLCRLFGPGPEGQVCSR